MSDPGKGARANGGTGAPAVRSLLTVAITRPATGEKPKKIKKKVLEEVGRSLRKAARTATDAGLTVELDLGALSAAAGRGDDAKAPAGTGGTTHAAPRTTAPRTPAPRRSAAPKSEARAATPRPPRPRKAAAAPPEGIQSATLNTPAHARRTTLRRTPARPPQP